VPASSQPSTRTGRILRRVFLGVHITVAVGFCLLLAIGITRHLRALNPPTRPPPGDVAGCVTEIEGLHAELVARLAALPTSRPASDQAPAFDVWSRPFRVRVETAGLRCAHPANATPGEARTLRRAIAKLTRFLDLSEIHVAHWSRHIGPAADEALEALGKLHPVEDDHEN
jgi:hypothetical protein